MKPRTKKSEEPTAATAATAPAAAAPAAAPAKKPAAAKPAKKAEAVKAVVEPAVEAVVEPTTEVKVEADSEAAKLAIQSADILSRMSAAMTTIAQLKTDTKALVKKYERELKAVQKASAKGKRKPGNRAPSGFVMPARISDELAHFLEKPIGTELARTEVTRALNRYINANNLKNKDNGRNINADEKLSKLLKLTPDIKLTYFNLQHYMSPHFAKKEKAAVAAHA